MEERLKRIEWMTFLIVVMLGVHMICEALKVL